MGYPKTEPGYLVLRMAAAVASCHPAAMRIPRFLSTRMTDLDRKRQARDRPIRLVVSNDNRLLVGVLADALRENGFDVVACRSTQEIIEAVECNADVDVVLTDILKPGLGGSGLDAVEQLRISHPQLPVLIVSAFDDPHAVTLSVLAGARGYIKAGAGLDELIPAIHRVAGGDFSFPVLPRDPSPKSEAEGRVLLAAARGASRAEIAAEVDMSCDEVERLIQALIRRAAAADEAAARAWFRQFRAS
jgi:DNA-binding NarL/FixJ family response regulator